METFDIYPVRIENQDQARKFLKDIGASHQGIDIMAPKCQHFALKVGPLSPQAAQIMKQELLSRGGETATNTGVLVGKEGSYVMLIGTLAQFRRLLPKLRMQPFGLPRLSGELEEVIANLSVPVEKRPLLDGKKGVLIGERTLVMGILNVTPDSFSDGGIFADPERAVDRGLEMEEQGADIIDVGGESTRPGHEPIDAGEELSRLLPVLERLASSLKAPISVDTYKARVAEAALEAGVDIINDVSGLADPDMARVVARHGVPLIIMHNQPEDSPDIMQGIIRSLKEKKQQAVEAGVEPGRIILDPGIGFHKDREQNLEVLNRLDALKCLGQPILLGTSRKSVIGKTLDLPVEERLEGTAATVAVGVLRGAHIVRVHDVREMVRVVRMTDAVVKVGRSSHG